MKEDRYVLISRFECYGKKMVVIKIYGNAHIMPQEELRWMFGQSHPERWNKRKNKHLSKLNNKKLVS